uniref:Uncharacterized protein TCIL3000_11_11860 n=1 Tax=Trypanosoma congolense (strain IL3000) TaxID=1068625 RepID=G0V222_TRYCI|nr:unnamed protein product [Trypanosoma congolense IL3000]
MQKCKSKPSAYVHIGSLLTMSHEVVNRVAMEREEELQFAYHMAKCEYDAAMNRVSSRLPPNPLITCTIDEDDISCYCSSAGQSRTNTIRGYDMMEVDLTDIDEELLKLAEKRRENDIEAKRLSRSKLNAHEILMRREDLARADIDHVETQFFKTLTAPFRKHSMFELLDFFQSETRHRKQVEDEWMTESVPFLEMCRTEQTDFMEDFLIRAIRRKNTFTTSSSADTVPFEKNPLDSRTCVPLTLRYNTIQKETESEQEIAYYYLMLGSAAQRDLIESNAARREDDSKRLDLVADALRPVRREAVNLAFNAEFRYLQHSEEAERMKVVDEFMAEREALLAEEEAKVAKRMRERANEE